MQLSVETYIPGSSPVHCLDARAKLIVLAVYSVMLFFLDTACGLGLAAVMFAAALAASRIPPLRVLGLVIPVYVLAALTVVFNGFTFATSDAIAQVDVIGSAVAGIYPIAGAFSLSVAGLMRGLFFAVRIVLLVFASLVLTFTTTSTELTAALNWFLRPLRIFRVPVDDIAMVFSIALRFIPVTAEEFCRVRDAQWSRGSQFGEGSLVARLKAWQTVLIPLFVGLFRRADVLAQAMDARCYGQVECRSSLNDGSWRGADAAVLMVCSAACVALAIVF